MRVVLILTLLLGGLGCAVYKPARVLAPERFGLTCVSDTLCVEDVERLNEAQAYVDRAMRFVAAQIGEFEDQPPLLFCSTQACFSRFNDPRVAAVNIGTFGIVINAHGWQDHILRHELIHHWQNVQFGRAQASVFLPRWYIEGMAYSLSQDPRRPLPREDIEVWREEFETWVAAGNDWRSPPR